MKKPILLTAMTLIASVWSLCMQAETVGPVTELIDGAEYYFVNANTGITNRNTYWKNDGWGFPLCTRTDGSVDDTRFIAKKIVEGENTYWAFKVASDDQQGKYIGLAWGCNPCTTDEEYKLLWTIQYEEANDNDGPAGLRLRIKGETDRSLMMNSTAETGTYVCVFDDYADTNTRTYASAHWLFYKTADPATYSLSDLQDLITEAETWVNSLPEDEKAIQTRLNNAIAAAKEINETSSATEIAAAYEELQEALEKAPRHYEFSVNDWTCSGSTINGNTFVTSDTGDHGISIDYRTERSLYIKPDEAYFVVKGTGLATNDENKHWLWWLNAANHGNNTPATDIIEKDGEVWLVWEIARSGVSDNISTTDITFLRTSGSSFYTIFGITKADEATEAVITYVGFLTADDLGYVIEEPLPYEFVVADWVAGDPARISSENVIADETSGTITVNKTGQNNVNLMFRSAQKYIVSDDTHYFVIRGTGFSTESGKAMLWWLNNNLLGDRAPSAIYKEDGEIVLAWNISGDGYGSTEVTLMDAGGWSTCFSLTLADEAVPAVISYIGFANSITITLDENSTDAPMAATGINVRALRTINAGNWSTLCLPFTYDIPEGWTAKRLTGSTVNGDNLSLQFTEVTTLEAGYPYIVKTTAHVSEITATNVDIVSEPIFDGDENISFVGTFNKQNMEVTTGTNIFFVQQNAFWLADIDFTMKGMRAYFLTDGTSMVKAVTADLDGNATGIEEVKSEEGKVKNDIYDLAGRRVVFSAACDNGNFSSPKEFSTLNTQLSTLPKGLYIVNGKKYFIQ